MSGSKSKKDLLGGNGADPQKNSVLEGVELHFYCFSSSLF